MGFLRKKRIDERGMALLTVLIVFTIVSILGVTLINQTMNNLNQSSTENINQASFYIAESGIHYAMDKLQSNLISIYENSSSESNFFQKLNNLITDLNSEPPYTNFEETFGDQPQFKIQVEEVNGGNSNSKKYLIVSRGTIGNSTRIVEKPIEITWIPKNNIGLPDIAVFVDNEINLSGGARIVGGLGTNSAANGSITLSGGASISGKIYVGPGGDENVIDKPNWMRLDQTITPLTNKKNYALPPFPDFPTNPIPENQRIYNSPYNYHDVIKNGSLRINSWIANGYTLEMSQDLQFNEMEITQNNTLNIDVGNQNRSIVIDHLDISNGKLNIVGTGKLTLYVKNKITMGAGSVINPPTRGQLDEETIKKLEIFYGGSKLEISGGQKIYGHLYARNADINMSGGAGFQGHIITGGREVYISGGTSGNIQLFYAPNIDFTISGGGNIKGTVIAKSLTGSGGGVINYNEIPVESLPDVLGRGSEGNVTLSDLIATEPIREI